MINNKGPKIEPWGTPDFNIFFDDILPSTNNIANNNIDENNTENNNEGVVEQPKKKGQAKKGTGCLS